MKRTVDVTGRFLLPKDMRVNYGLDIGAKYELIEESDGIKIKPFTTRYVINEEHMKVLRKLYILLYENNLLDSYYNLGLSEITKRADIKCDKCGNFLFLDENNSYKCFKCGDK